MKKVFKFMVVLFAVASLTSCVSMIVANINPNAETLDEYKAAAETMTPENSVVIVGIFGGLGEGYMEQINPAYPRDVQNFASNVVVVSKPVKPGSTYCLKDITFSVPDPEIYNRWISGEIDQTRRFQIKVPKEPGIYYVGPFYMYELYRYEMGKSDNPRRAPKGIMQDPKSVFTLENKALLIHYKGTCWEPYINENIKKGFDGVKHNEYLSEDMLK